MSKTLNFFVTIAIVIIIAPFIIWNNYSEISTFFSNFSDSSKGVLCVEFKTEIKTLRPLIQKVNNLKREKIKDTNHTCSTTSYVNIGHDSNHPPKADEIWGLYYALSNFKLINFSLPFFLNKYLKGSIGTDNCDQIIAEIKSWLDNPQMDSYYREQINSALK